MALSPKAKAVTCKDCLAAPNLEGDCRQAQTYLLERFQWNDFVVLDTETNGTGGQTEVIEVGVVAADGTVLFESLIKPRVAQMNPFAQRIHGISLAELRDAPHLPEVLCELTQAVGDRLVLAWNASFDEGMMIRSCRTWALEPPAWRFACAMRTYAMAVRRRGRGGYKCKLDTAIANEGVADVVADLQAHRAASDALRTLAVLRAVRDAL